jgi:hypothetical protein
MIWYRLIVLLLLPLGLGGCWERSTRLQASSTAPYAWDGITTSRGDDLPTPRLFQIDNSRSFSE